ncbi:MAG TPA: nitroreductase/quinone reductase family protein [Terriglobales bacterium]|nr:nitroreductase/quinone reductase family protein [Terriglobales bacterium]
MTTYMRPSYVVGRIVNPLVAALGAKPGLATRGHVSGRWRTVPVNVLDRGGRRYLVSTRGEAFWVRNLRHHPEAELRHRGRVERVRTALVPDAERPALIAAYLERWFGEAGAYFRRLPDPSDHPVFELEPAAP